MKGREMSSGVDRNEVVYFLLNSLPTPPLFLFLIPYKMCFLKRVVEQRCIAETRTLNYSSPNYSLSSDWCSSLPHLRLIPAATAHIYIYKIINIIDTLNCCQKPFTDTNNTSLGQQVSITRTLVIIVRNVARNYKTNVYTVLVQTNEGKRPFEKPRGGQNITTDFEETGRRGVETGSISLGTDKNGGLLYKRR